MNQTRDAARRKFLLENGFGNAACKMIAGDASFRKYYRITQAEHSVILMDAPPPQENILPFVGMANCLRDMGYSAPETYQMNTAEGFLVLSDLGDDSFNLLVRNKPDLERTLYESAVDLLIDLQKQKVSPTCQVNGRTSYDLKPYSSEVLLTEARLLHQWTLGSLCGRDTARDDEFDRLLKPLLDSVSTDNSVLSLRDYHVDNLMWLPERDGLSKVGLLDFQDALFGHPAYDLVSLLQDARRDVSPALERELIKRFIDKSGIQDSEKFHRAYAILGMQRNAKIVGIFTRLYLRDGKKDYLPMIPRVWGLLERNFWLEELAPLKQWTEQYVPVMWRRDIITPDQFQEVSQ